MPFSVAPSIVLFSYVLLLLGFFFSRFPPITHSLGFFFPRVLDRLEMFDSVKTIFICGANEVKLFRSDRIGE